MIEKIKENWFNISVILLLIILTVNFFLYKQHQAEISKEIQKIDQENIEIEREKQEAEILLNERRENRIDEELKKKEKQRQEQIELERQALKNTLDNEIRKIEIEAENRNKNRIALSNCLDIARYETALVWNNWCKSIGRNDNCKLTSFYTTKANNVRQNKYNICFKIYNN